jgi:hypothetical protein
MSATAHGCSPASSERRVCVFVSGPKGSDRYSQRRSPRGIVCSPGLITAAAPNFPPSVPELDESLGMARRRGRSGVDLDGSDSPGAVLEYEVDLTSAAIAEVVDVWVGIGPACLLHDLDCDERLERDPERIELRPAQLNDSQSRACGSEPAASSWSTAATTSRPRPRRQHTSWAESSDPKSVPRPSVATPSCGTRWQRSPAWSEDSRAVPDTKAGPDQRPPQHLPFATSAHAARHQLIAPPLLGALTKGRGSTKAVTTAPTPGRPLKALSGTNRDRLGADRDRPARA